MATRENHNRQENEEERQTWTVGVTVLLSVLVFLLVALLMIGIPYLNAHLVRDTGLTSGDLASWQITAVITMVGVLIGGVFIITAFRVDATAKQIAFDETRKVVKRELEEQKQKLENEITGEIADAKTTIDKAKSDMKKVADDGESDIAKTLNKGNSAIGRVVQDAEIRATAAIDSESNRFTEATRAALAQSEREFRQSIEQIQADSQAVREFLDERAPSVVRESFADERLEAIQKQVVDKLSKEFLVEQITKAVRAIVDEQPRRLVDPVVERVVALGRWRWLFRKDGAPPE